VVVFFVGDGYVVGDDIDK